MKKRLSKKDYETFAHLLDKASRNELDELDEMVQKEIRLSETAISEGQEKR